MDSEISLRSTNVIHDYGLPGNQDLFVDQEPHPKAHTGAAVTREKAPVRTEKPMKTFAEGK